MEFTPLVCLLMIARTLYHFLCFFSLSTLSRKAFLDLFLHLKTKPTLQLLWREMFAYSTQLVKYKIHMYFCSYLNKPCSDSNYTVDKVKTCPLWFHCPCYTRPLVLKVRQWHIFLDKIFICSWSGFHLLLFSFWSFWSDMKCMHTDFIS